MITSSARHIASMRTHVLAFLGKQTAPVGLDDIKAAIGLAPWKCNGWLDRALRTTRITVQRDHPFIVYDGDKPLMRSAQPVRLFSLTAPKEAA